mmetsp:Transcript_6315/g.19512  ORF Transcript_6315/g.19512 Transcript_6315/m.19512 type:complete len:297 (-) Transcript_6315:968-1858(-)
MFGATALACSLQHVLLGVLCRTVVTKTVRRNNRVLIEMRSNSQLLPCYCNEPSFVCSNAADRTEQAPHPICRPPAFCRAQTQFNRKKPSWQEAAASQHLPSSPGADGRQMAGRAACCGSSQHPLPLSMGITTPCPATRREQRVAGKGQGGGGRARQRLLFAVALHGTHSRTGPGTCSATGHSTRRSTPGPAVMLSGVSHPYNSTLCTARMNCFRVAAHWTASACCVTRQGHAASRSMAHAAQRSMAHTAHTAPSTAASAPANSLGSLALLRLRHDEAPRAQPREQRARAAAQLRSR